MPFKEETGNWRAAESLQHIANNAFYLPLSIIYGLLRSTKYNAKGCLHPTSAMHGSVVAHLFNGVSRHTVTLRRCSVNVAEVWQGGNTVKNLKNKTADGRFLNSIR